MTTTFRASEATKARKIPALTYAKPATTLDRLLAELGRDGGATIDELATSTGWQKHSVRGAMAGALKRTGHKIASIKTEGVRRYLLVTDS